ncbi:MAG TPA: hypothetical protein VFR64_06065 [Methylomirabilota bacterium]|jgi:hypothetical protein|nr:hypothetical protein [Methylomirabilota bacterium]
MNNEPELPGLLLSCREHAIAFCGRCARRYGSRDLFIERVETEYRFRCPTCGSDLTDAIVDHVWSCRAFSGRKAS